MIFQLSNTLDTHFYTAHYIPSTCIVVDGCYENVENGAFLERNFTFPLYSSFCHCILMRK